MSTRARLQSLRSRLVLLVVIGLCGVAVSAALFVVLRAREEVMVATQFAFDAQQRANAIERTLGSNLQVLNATVALWGASEKVERYEFCSFIERLLAELPGIGGLLPDESGIEEIGWAPRVEVAGREQHEAEARKEAAKGYGEYAVRQYGVEGKLVAAGRRDTYFPAAFLRARNGGVVALGFDFASEPAYRALIERAARERQPQGALWNSPADAGADLRWLVVVPVFENPRAGDQPAHAAPELKGVVFGLFLPRTIVESSLAASERLGIDLYLFDESPAAGPRLLYQRPSTLRSRPFVPMQSPPEATDDAMPHAADLKVLGHRWKVYAAPTDAYVAERRTWLPPTALLSGLIITALSMLYVNALVGRRQKVEQLAVQRTAELHQASASLGAEVAERRRAEQILRDSQALYSSLVENLPVHVLRKDLAGRFTFANRLFCGLLGRSFEEILGKTDFDFYPPELATKYREDDKRVAETGQIFEDVEKYEKDGETCYMHVMKSAVRDAAGQIVGVQAVFWDVTNRKRAEEALDRERYLLHSLMDNIPDNIYFKDRESRFLRISKAQAAKFGLGDASEAVGKTDFDFFTDEHAHQAREDEEELVQSGRPMVGKEEKETWPDGHTTWVSTTKLPLRDREGKIVGTFGISRDITAQKQAAEALRAAKDAAETANRAKSAFLANMSHEIRTPLNAIIGMTELVLETGLTTEQREHLGVVRDSGEALLSLINDILDFSKIEADRLVLDTSTFDLYETLGDTMRWLAVRAHGKGLELACRFRPDVPSVVVGDCTRLRQVIVNLVGNAIKFTEQGEVVLEVQPESQADGQIVLHFAVADTGIGIPEGKRDVIFRVFEQADASTTRRYGGTGLGLAISAKLVELMGGRIWVDSEVGRGSTFHFTAQFGQVEGEPSPAEPATARLCGTRILVVDDNATNRLILREMLTNWGMAPSAVGGAREAIGRLEQAKRSGEPFRVVLTDANMPEVDGFTLVEQIKTHPELDGTVIMMLTSGDRPDDVTRCERLGIAAYLLKPIKQSELLDALMMGLGITRAEDETAETPRPVEQVQPLKILVAEDSLVSQKLVSELLARRGHRAKVVGNGKEAVAAAQCDRFDLILMDVQMPEMDGLEASAAIRAHEKAAGRHTPIIAMTAHAMRGDRERCLEAGMDDYVTKPIHARQLFERIDAVFGVRPPAQAPAGGNRPEPDQEPPEPAEPTEAAAAGAGAATGPVDLSEALRGVRGDRELLRSIVETYFAELPPIVAAIRQAVAARDLEALRRPCHTLKGSLRYVGARSASAIAERLEIAAREGRQEGLDELLTALDEQLPLVAGALGEYLEKPDLPEAGSAR